MALVAAPLVADEVHLRGGGRLTGEIAEQNEQSVTVDIGAGKMTVPMSSVVSIDKSTSPLQEYRARAATLAANDIEGWRKLGQWANQHGLSKQAHDAYMQVHNAYPGDLEANRALGLVEYGGRWIPEEEAYEARGFVKFEGEWMMPAERDGILRERDTRAEANRSAVMATVEASEKERKEREAEEARREEEEARRNRLPTLGDSWNWGFAGYYAPVW